MLTITPARTAADVPGTSKGRTRALCAAAGALAGAYPAAKAARLPPAEALRSG